jgi:hypothetical protein
MFRRLTIVLLGIAMLASASPARAQVPPEVVKLAGEFGLKVATVIGPALVDMTVANMTKKYSARAISSTYKLEKPEQFMAIVQTVHVKMEAGEDGKVVFSSSSAATIRMRLDVDVDVALLFPMKDIRRDSSGKFVLPTLDLYRNVLPGYRKPPGDRATGEYEGSGFFYWGGWSEDKKNTVKESLAYQALDQARKMVFDDRDKIAAAFDLEAQQELNSLVDAQIELRKLIQKRVSSTKAPK